MIELMVIWVLDLYLICAGGFICGVGDPASSSRVVSFHNNPSPSPSTSPSPSSSTSSSHPRWKASFPNFATISILRIAIIMSKPGDSIYQISSAIIGDSWLAQVFLAPKPKVFNWDNLPLRCLSAISNAALHENSKQYLVHSNQDLWSVFGS